jgi:RNA polymerase sigma-70 factor (ECF subfamily)
MGLSVRVDVPSTSRAPDAVSAAWLRDLAPAAPEREPAIARLHALLLGAARAELHRRSGSDVGGPELDDLAHQAAGDSLVAILAKLDSFRGESRFTTWAYRFVVLDVSTKLGRHFWRAPRATLAEEDWERLPSRFGLDPQHRAEWHDLVTAIRDAVDDELTVHQREVFSAIVLQGIPLDALVLKLDSSRNAIYKTMFDARRKLRLALAAKGYVGLDIQGST